MNTSEANQLRIGNLLSLNGIITPPLDAEKILNISTIESYAAQHEPIPLTENWLTRLGFESAETLKDHNGGFLSPVIVTSKEMARIRVKNGIWDSGYSCVDLRFVHQLQNLWMVLTGTELEVRP